MRRFRLATPHCKPESPQSKPEMPRCRHETPRFKSATSHCKPETRRFTFATPHCMSATRRFQQKNSGREQRNVKARLLSATTGSGRRNAASLQGLLANNTPLQRALQRSWQGFCKLRLCAGCWKKEKTAVLRNTARSAAGTLQPKRATSLRLPAKALTSSALPAMLASSIRSTS